jgi:hypothetical protein
LSGAVAALPGCGLSRRWRKRVHIGRKCDQAQVIAAIQGQLGDDLVLDDCTDRRSFGLQEIRRCGNFDRLADLTDLENDVETHGLLYLDIEWFANRRFETWKFRSKPV